MKTKYLFSLCFIILHSSFCLPAFAQGTAFTYQGRLNDGVNPASGTYDLRFTIYDSTNSPGVVIAGPLTNATTAVSNGLFTVTLDFGAGVFTGPARWLEIGVRTNGSVAPHTALAPRQPLTATPYAITAGSLVAGGLPAGSYGNAVNFNNSANQFAGSFAGNGGGLSNVNALTLGGLTSGSFWQTNGNAGANPTNGAFLGTTDNLPLEFRVNGKRILRLESVSSNEVNVIGGSVGNLVTDGAYGATVWGGGFDGLDNHGNTVSGNFGTVSGGRQNSANNAETTVAGGRANAANGANSTIGGGYANIVNGAYGSIAGGIYNLLTGADNAAIGGGYQNTIQANSTYATISGGGANIILSNSPRGTIGGGIVNTVGAQEGTVAGGAFNSALAFSSTIGGGGGNTVSGEWATIGGGRANALTNADYATIGGGYLNTIQSNAPYATIGGGYNNVIQTNAVTSAIAGGHDNTIQSAAHSAIGGGGYNTIQPNAHDSVIGGGGYNTIQTNADSSVIGGGGINLIQSGAPYSTIGGGLQNTILNGSTYASIGGGKNNTAGYAWSVIVGGEYNTNSALKAFIGAGDFNLVGSGGAYAFVGGGYQNINNGYTSFLGGGYQNTIQANADSSAILGGFLNTIQASAGGSTIGGGSQNTIQPNALYATIPGGFSNSAAANFAFAAGRSAKANHTGAFVWADSTAADFVSTAINQFLIRAGGGVAINKNNPATALDVNGTVTATGFSGNAAGLTSLNAANLSGSVPVAALTSVPAGSLTGTISDARLSSNVALRSGGNAFTGTQTISGGSLGIGITPQSTLDVNGTARIDGNNNWNVTGSEGDFRVGNDSFRFKIGVANGGGGAGDVWMRAHGGTARVFIKTPGGTTFFSNEGETAGISLAANGTAWAVISDRNVKKDIAPVDQRTILEKLAAMPITQWHYKWESPNETPHIGPMAQDFKAAFYPGTDDKSITTQEADGVALAAIQGLNQKMEAGSQRSEDRMQKLETENAELKQRLEKLERLMSETSGGAK